MIYLVLRDDARQPSSREPGAADPTAEPEEFGQGVGAGRVHYVANSTNGTNDTGTLQASFNNEDLTRDDRVDNDTVFSSRIETDVTMDVNGTHRVGGGRSSYSHSFRSMRQEGGSSSSS